MRDEHTESDHRRELLNNKIAELCQSHGELLPGNYHINEVLSSNLFHYCMCLPSFSPVYLSNKGTYDSCKVDQEGQSIF